MRILSRVASYPTGHPNVPHRWPPKGRQSLWAGRIQRNRQGFVAHDFHRKSSVLYLCEGDGEGAGSLARLSGDQCAPQVTKRKAGSLRKAQAASLCLLPSVEQRYIKPRRSGRSMSMKIDLPKWEIESALLLWLFSSLACSTLGQA